MWPLFLAFFALSPSLAGEALTLDQALALAQTHSPRLEIERAGESLAQADQAIVRSQYLPKVSGVASYVRLDPNRLSPLGATGVPGTTMFGAEAYVGAAAKQMLFDATIPASLKAASSGVRAQVLSTEQALSETQFAVTVAYVRLAQAQQLIDVARAALERQSAFEDLTSTFYEAGKISRLDLLKARSQRTDTERALVAATESEALAKAVLFAAMGSPKDIVVGVVHVQDALIAGDLPDEIALFDLARQNNPALRQLSPVRDQAESAVSAAQATHLPTVSAVATYGYRDRDGGGADEYTVGAFLEWTAFSGGAINGQVRRLQANQARIDASRQVLEDQVRVELQEALMRWRVADANLAFAAQSVELNVEALDAANTLFATGAVTALEVLTSQADLARAESSLMQARGDYVVAQAMIDQVTGRTPSSSSK